ncbi:hypothetical protein CALVIDRAFT_205322 [Calocera viscosa TUFC12733]|uniref:Uncharacterized protein n=1 Tax=Calocera viscosa (strain TUFC12733) TaxID=1330018 RepID=A0A167KDP7_CALVF|nr:hypothetical protein CALVIDRAFT_205322 [Calocera viscosa TUFC12733]
MSSATPGQVGSPEPMSTTSTRPSKRSLESPEQQARGEGEDDRTKRRRSDEDASVGRAEQRTASSSRAASAMERGIREMELQDQQPDRAPVVSAADQRTSVDRDASASDIDMDVDEPQASSSAAQLSTVSQSRFGVRLPTISSFDRGGPHSSSSDDDPWLTPNETPQGSQHRARSPPSTEAVRSEFARAQRFSDTLAPLRRSPSPRPAPQAEHTPGHFGDFLSRLRPVVRESTPPSSATGSTFHWDPYSQMGATAPNALPERHAPLSLSLPRSQNSSRSSGTVLPHLGASERLAQVPTSPPHPLFEASWLRHPSVGGPSMLPAGQAGVRHQPPPAPHSPLLHPSLHSPPPPRSPPDSPPRGHFSLPPHFRRSSGSPASPYSDESDIAPTIFPGSPYPRFAPSPGPYVHHPDLPRNSSRERDPRDNEPQSQQVPRSQAPVLPNFGSTSPRQFSQPASPVQPQNGPYNAGTNTDRSESRATARSRDTGHNQMRLPPIRTRGPLPRLSSVVAGFPDEQPASRQEEHNVLSNAAASSRQILETLIRMREANSHRPPPETNESMTIDRNRAQTIAENEQDLGQYWTSTRAAVQPQTSNVREQAPRQDVAQRSTRRVRTFHSNDGAESSCFSVGWCRSWRSAWNILRCR